VIRPLKGSISHAEVYFSLLLHVGIVCLFRDLHGPVEVLGTGVVVTLLSQNFSELHIRSTLTLPVLQLVGELQIPLDEHLHLILVHLRVDLVASDLSKVTNGHGLACHTTHLDCIS
jgi:hypothetical protein